MGYWAVQTPDFPTLLYSVSLSFQTAKHLLVTTSSQFFLYYLSIIIGMTQACQHYAYTFEKFKLTFIDESDPTFDTS